MPTPCAARPGPRQAARPARAAQGVGMREAAGSAGPRHPVPQGWGRPPRQAARRRIARGRPAS
eukprot:10800202-Lingulodinium_polyedra.AAC.1